jgi:imidazole glycerol-phosphate synthase subunit HisH
MSKTTIAIIDYGMGNRRSVEKAFLKVEADAFITGDPRRVLDADGAVVVGVGAFPEAMRQLESRGMLEVLKERRGLERPILGICLGLQIFFEHSDEHGGKDGLKFIDGQVHELQPNGLKVPQIGWNQVEWSQGSRLGKGISEQESTFYHLHSFAAYDAARPDAFFERKEIVGRADYTCKFATAIEKPPIYGVQFHPEKSSKQGLKLLENFTGICAESAAAR